MACRSAAEAKTCARSPPFRLARNLPPTCQTYLKPSPCAMGLKFLKFKNFSWGNISFIKIFCLGTQEAASVEQFELDVIGGEIVVFERALGSHDIPE